MSPTAQRGLTLIELMITVSLIVLLMQAVAPSLSVWMSNSQIRNLSGSIQAGLQRARSEAVARNQPVRFALVSLTDSAVMDNSCTAVASGVSWVVSLDDPTSQCATAASETNFPRIIDKRAGGIGRKTASVTSSTAGGAASNGVVVFNSFGRVVGTDGVAVLDVDNLSPGDDYRALRILLGAGGTTRLCEPKVTSVDDPRHC